MPRPSLFGSSLTKKYWMALTGFFLITFLVVHATINGMIFWNDGGVTFNKWAHIFATNFFIRAAEIVLFLGLIVHSVDGLMLYFQNRGARPVKYAHERGNANSRWYTRSMGILGTLILLFIIVHLWNFWIPSRGIVGSLEPYGRDAAGRENIFKLMREVFSDPLAVVIYLLGCFSLFWHLLHGFKSAFQSMGWSHPRYNTTFRVGGATFSVVVPAFFAAMPVSMYFGWIK